MPGPQLRHRPRQAHQGCGTAVHARLPLQRHVGRPHQAVDTRRMARTERQCALHQDIRLHEGLSAAAEGSRCRARPHPDRQRDQLRHALGRRGIDGQPLLCQQYGQLAALHHPADTGWQGLSRGVPRRQDHHPHRARRTVQRHAELLPEDERRQARLRHHRTVVLSRLPQGPQHARGSHQEPREQLRRQRHHGRRDGLQLRLGTGQHDLRLHQDLSLHGGRTA